MALEDCHRQIFDTDRVIFWLTFWLSWVGRSVLLSWPYESKGGSPSSYSAWSAKSLCPSCTVETATAFGRVVSCLFRGLIALATLVGISIAGMSLVPANRARWFLELIT